MLLHWTWIALPGLAWIASTQRNLEVDQKGDFEEVLENLNFMLLIQGRSCKVWQDGQDEEGDEALRRHSLQVSSLCAGSTMRFRRGLGLGLDVLYIQ